MFDPSIIIYPNTEINSQVFFFFIKESSMFFIQSHAQGPRGVLKGKKIKLSSVDTLIMLSGGNADIPYIWGTESGPYMQALHMCFCLGAILSPLATEPFLSKKVCQESNNTTENSTLIPLSGKLTH